MTKFVDIDKIVKILENYYPEHYMERQWRGQPYKVLVSCVLSLRNRDEVTFPIAEKLFKIADTPQKILDLPMDEFKKIVKSINFYDSKAENIKTMTKTILEKYNGEVPSTEEELLEFRGVGRKTANVVLSTGFGKLTIAVDTHVHRISNRLGLVETKTPEETEFALKEKVPKRYWLKFNPLLVSHGQKICRPIGPQCDVCPIFEFCNQIGVIPRKTLKKT